MQNIPINKGNYYMETVQREHLFDTYRGEGWEEEYKKYRKDWTENARSQIVSDWPLLVDLELSSICNLSCPMCYTITQQFQSRVFAGLISEELFVRLIDEIAGHVTAIRLSLRGEPTLHPRLADFIRYAKQKGIKEVSFLSNGSRFTDDYIRQLIQAGTDWITVSIDGIGAVYEQIRKPLKFEETYEKLRRFSEIKKELGVHKPVIKIQGIWPAVRSDVQQYYEIFEPVTDAIAINPLIDYLDQDTDIVYDEKFSCPQLYQRLVVTADGKALLCSNDEENMQVIGDLTRETIYDVWHGSRLEEIRKLHKKTGGFKQIPVCRKCYLPRATHENEVCVVRGRKIAIPNYIGRSQKIGE